MPLVTSPEDIAMPDLEDFLTKLDGNPIAALDEYRFHVEEEGLDVVKGTDGGWVETEFRQVEVAFDYNGNDVTVRLAGQTDSHRNTLRIWYLPWKRSTSGAKVAGLAKAELDGTGPGIFLTSHLNGCRFTLQFHSGDDTKVTVLHVAGDLGEGMPGHKTREEAEKVGLTGVPGSNPRRYSIGRIGNTTKAKLLTTGSGTRAYYDGNAATVLGVRGQTRKWMFYAQQYGDLRGGPTTKAL
jgi:hypothetical protein